MAPDPGAVGVETAAGEGTAAVAEEAVMSSLAAEAEDSGGCGVGEGRTIMRQESPSVSLWARSHRKSDACLELHELTCRLR
ncbi:hypothetical protein PI126_g978 [Phytophthora idaei]|nr:hypothetical protein PI126_g978 [Phytophthora idaei]